MPPADKVYRSGIYSLALRILYSSKCSKNVSIKGNLIVQILSKFKISSIIAAVAAVPTLAYIVISLSYMGTLSEQIDRANLTMEAVELSAYLDEVAHTHAVERGATAGFLASKGENGADALVKARAASDKATDALMQLNSSDFTLVSPAIYDNLTSPVLDIIKQKTAVRKDVDAFDKSVKPFGYYSSINRVALENIQRLLMMLEDTEVASLMDNRIQLLWIKERAGQVRGALNGIFKADRSSKSQRANISEFLKEEQEREKLFTLFALKKDADALSNLESESHWRQIAKVTDDFVNSNQLEGLNGPDDWFTLATQRIKDIKSLSDSIGHSLIDLSQNHLSSAKNRLWGVFGTMVLMLVVIVMFSLIVRRTMSRRVREINEYIENISDNKDFTSKMSDAGSDELGDICAGLNNHVASIDSCFIGQKELLNAAFENIHKVEIKSKQCAASASTQRDETTQIACAIEEMSQAGLVTAEELQIASDKVDEIKRVSSDCHQRIAKLTVTIDGVDHKIELSHLVISQVAENTQNITGILQTIESIAEQTNLLALNAAIEAARAGEQGRGFAVVADEVRNLAKRTQAATFEINDMISGLLSSSSEAHSKMNECLSAIRDSKDQFHLCDEMLLQMNTIVSDLHATMMTVASASEEQMQVKRSISQNAQVVDTGASEIACAVMDTQQAIDEMTAGFVKVLNDIKQYRLSC